MSWYGYSPWPKYVPVGERRIKAQAHAKKLAKKGRTLAPVELAGRAITTTFWGRAWCENLERYSDYENRLPRGRSYVRNGSIVDLQIEPGIVAAIVSGSRIYDVKIRIKPLEPARWKKLCGECAGKIESAVELLKGGFSSGIMAIMTDKSRGLFPAPKEISIECSCPDYAGLCKHSAAVLYGVGARLDLQPELLFRLRKVDEVELIAHAGAAHALTRRRARGGTRRLDEKKLSDVFGIDVDAGAGGVRAGKSGKSRREKIARKPAPMKEKRKAAGRTSKNRRPAAPRKKS